MAYVYVIVGLVLLVGGGDVLVRGAVSLAYRLGVTPLVIGLTVVAFGTSAPELLVGVQAALVGAPTLALGNVVGSNIANVLLVVGVPALIFPIVCKEPGLRRNVIIMLGATAFFILLCYTGVLDRWRGALLFAGLLAFLGYSFWRAKHEPGMEPTDISDVEGVPDKPYGVGFACLMIGGGLAALVLGADTLVDGSVTIARTFGVSEALIGLTLVAIGTSLPELVTSVMAAVHRHGGIAVGNVVGSNIFNLLGIMGVTAMVAPVPVPDSFLNFDLWVMAGSSLLLLPFVMKRATIGIVSGLGLLACYGGYLALLTWIEV